MNTSALCKEVKNKNHQHMKTKAIDNEVHPEGTTSLGPGIKIV